jgi:hypothetical protein
MSNYFIELVHRALAAFLADSRRASEDSLSARALPPLSPPRRPRDTAAAFLCLFGGGDGSPVSKRPISCARSFESRESSLGVIMPSIMAHAFHVSSGKRRPNISK